MHGVARHLDALYYGYSDRALYLRLDLNEAFLENHPEFEIRVNINDRARARLHAQIRHGALGSIEVWRRDEQLPVSTLGEQVQVAFGRIFELGLDYALLGPSATLRLQISLWADELPLQVIPHQGWLTLEITKDLVSW
jgi:hypothetical protein